MINFKLRWIKDTAAKNNDRNRRYLIWDSKNAYIFGFTIETTTFRMCTYLIFIIVHTGNGTGVSFMFVCAAMEMCAPLYTLHIFFVFDSLEQHVNKCMSALWILITNTFATWHIRIHPHTTAVRLLPAMSNRYIIKLLFIFLFFVTQSKKLWKIASHNASLIH